MGQIEWFSSTPARFPSAPVWHAAERRIYWSDISGNKFYRTDPDSGETETLLDDGRPVFAVVVQADGSVLLFRDQGWVVALRNGKICETIVQTTHDLKRVRYSCATADVAGRVVCATLSDQRHPARLFLIDRRKRMTLLLEMVGRVAGLAFADNGRTLLLSNSYPTRAHTLRIPYDPESDEPITGPSGLFHSTMQDHPRPRGTPAGTAVVDDGSVLIARLGGASIVRHAPDGEKTGTFQLHVQRPVGLCFGGDGLENLFATTAGAHRLAIDGAHAGEIAVLRGFAIKGAPVPLSRIGLPDKLDDSQDQGGAAPTSEGASSPKSSAVPKDDTPPPEASLSGAAAADGDAGEKAGRLPAEGSPLPS